MLGPIIPVQATGRRSSARCPPGRAGCRRPGIRRRPAGARTASAWSYPCSSISQPPGMQVRRRLADDGANVVQAVAARPPGRPGVRGPARPDAGRPRRDVGRVADDQVEALVACRPARTRWRKATSSRSRGHWPRATSSAPALLSVAITWASGRARLRARAMAPLPGAQIDHARRGTVPNDLQRPFDQRFGVRPRHQHARVHLQVEAEKFLAADDVGQRFAGGPALAQLA